MSTDTPQTWADMARELQAANARLREELAQAKRGSDRLLSAMRAEEEKLRPLIEKAGCDPQHHGADIAVKELLIRAEQAESRTLAAENALEVIAGIKKCDDRSIRSNSDYAMRVLQKRDAAIKGSAT